MMLSHDICNIVKAQEDKNKSFSFGVKTAMTKKSSIF